MSSGRVAHSVNSLVDSRDGRGLPGGIVEEAAVESVRTNLEGDGKRIEDVGSRSGNFLTWGEEGAVEILTDNGIGVPVDA